MGVCFSAGAPVLLFSNSTSRCGVIGFVFTRNFWINSILNTSIHNTGTRGDKEPLYGSIIYILLEGILVEFVPNSTVGQSQT